MAEALGIGVQILSAFSARDVEPAPKRVLTVPAHLRIAFAVRLGYPGARPAQYLRFRRDIEEFTHLSGFGNKGLDGRMPGKDSR